MADPIKKLDDLQDIARDTNVTAKKIDAKTEKSRVKRLSAFALVMLLVYLLVTLGLTVKDLSSAVHNLNRTTPALVESNNNLTKTNKGLTDTNNNLTKANARALAERNAAVNIAAEQARRLRDAGIPAVDPFDPAVCCPSQPASGANSQKSPTTRPGTMQNGPSKAPKSPSGSSRPSASPSPRPTPKKTPSPSEAPLAQICAPRLPCVTIPPLTTPVSVQPVNLQGEHMDPSYDFFHLDAMATVKLISAFLPLLVAVLTKRYATGALKGVLNFFLSTVTGSIGYLVGADGGYDLRGFINSALNAVVVSGVAYLMVWKPTGVAGTVAVATEKFGIGKEPALETDDVGREDTTGSRKG